MTDDVMTTTSTSTSKYDSPHPQMEENPNSSDGGQRMVVGTSLRSRSLAREETVSSVATTPGEDDEDKEGATTARYSNNSALAGGGHQRHSDDELRTSRNVNMDVYVNILPVTSIYYVLD